MESPPLARYVPPPKTKKRVFPGSSSSSSSYMEPEVIQASPPKPWSSRSNSDEQSEVIYPEVIDIEMDEDSGDFMGVDDKIYTPNKGKEVLASFSYSHRNSAKPGSKDAVVQSSKKMSVPGSHNSFDLEGFTPSLLDLASHGEDDFMDMYHDDLTYDDKYAFLQAHFDSMDTPPGVEAPVPWFSEPAWIKKNPATETGKKSNSVSSSSSQTQMDTPSHPYGMVLPPSWSFSEDVQNEMKSYDSVISNNFSSEIESGATNLPSGFPSWGVPGFSHGKKKPAVSGSTTNYNLHNQLGKIKLGSHHHIRRKKPVGNGTLAHPKFTTMDPTNLPPGVDAYMSGWQGSPAFMNQHFTSDALYYSSDDADFWVDLDPAKTELSATAAGCSTLPFASTSSILENRGNEKDILSKFQLFKQFDTVQDCSDHHYSSNGSSAKQPSKTWAKKIQEEWRILEKDLPDSIFVRVYESRMDLLRAVIVGAEGTPYHDGLFFFDVFFPCSYPSVPPLVYYHSGGLRINPNLYNCGKVCLSLLNTWSGSQNEMWVPRVSTMLQVLVSIQALILNAKPYFNEPGFAGMSGSAAGEKKSQQYNENTFILSLKTMLYTMRRPPKHFEDFVAGHFCKYAQDILMACKAYMDGVQVGCLAKVGLQDVAAGDKVWSQFFKDTSVVQDVDAGDKSCSHFLKNALAGHITLLVQTFTQVGAKDCDNFLPLAEKENSQPTPMPVAANHY